MGEMLDDRQIADLHVLLDVSRELGASTELVPMLVKVEQAVLQVLDCERGTVFLYDKNKHELYSLVATGEETIRFSADLGIAGESMQARAIINVCDAYADPRFNPAIDKQTGFRTRNLLTFPMPGHDATVIGVLQALNKRAGSFDETDEERATVLGMLAGVAIQRQMLLDEFAHKKQLERDLSLARDIQQRLLPTSDPEIAGYEVAGWNKPADATGGDCYDYIFNDDGRLGVLLADVTGHGIGPALIVAECRALIRAVAAVSDDLGTIMTRANLLLNKDLSGGRFSTTYFGWLDPVDHTIQYLSAGHGPLIHYVRASGHCRELPATTYPMGILPDIDATPAEPIALARGDMMVLVTDGFHEWPNPRGEQFGIERVNAVVHEHRDRSPSCIIKELHASVATFGDGTPQRDDLTAVIIKRL